ncbi:MAG: hypothetical protein M8861_06265 [marine benthic group bacterium]|nr:hypothetical protein [Gemmatimonadota bacterium]
MSRPSILSIHRSYRSATWRGLKAMLIAFLTDPFSIRDVLSHLREPLRPPKVHPARGPPELAFGFADASDEYMDQTPAVDPTEPEPIPPYPMDQTRSW